MMNRATQDDEQADQSADREAEPLPTGRSVRLCTFGGIAVAAVLALGYVASSTDRIAGFGTAVPGKPMSLGSSRILDRVGDLTVDDKAQIIVEGNDARERNAGLPFLTVPMETARAFALGNMATDNARTALKCLTQAVYYEAAFEPIEGRRAVAQVVLNRVRHPSYPRSVCGVVYQGSTRRTGCQFSFTCDGSLLRAPAPAAWREARIVASAALDGHTENSVGTATHYHADYVLPKWAFTLGKLNKIGAHIFYRFKGRAGGANAFSSAYLASERIPSLNVARLRERVGETQFASEETYTPGLTVAPHVTDRHAHNDVGGRLDTSKPWRLSIPDPTEASSRLRETIQGTQSADNAEAPDEVVATP